MIKTNVLSGIALATFWCWMATAQAQPDVPTSGQTATRDTSCTLNAGINFKGRLTRALPSELLQLEGYISLRIAQPYLQKEFPIDASVHPDSISFPLKVKTPPLAIGLFFSQQDHLLYNRWVEQPIELNDVQLAIAAGHLTYQPFDSLFIMGPKAKLAGRAYRGTTCSVDSAQSVVTTSGKITLPIQPANCKWSIDLAGSWEETRAANYFEAKTLARVKLHKVPKKAWEKLADQAQVVCALNESIDWSDPLLLQSIAEFKDPDMRKAPKHMDEFLVQKAAALTYQDLQSCDHIDADLLLSGIKFRQDNEMHTLWYGGQVGVVGIGGQEVGKMSSSNSKIEYQFGIPVDPSMPTSDTLRIYLEFDEVNWVYFEQYGETLNTSSSDIDGYNAVLAPRDKSSSSEGEVRKDRFLNQFANTYIWRTGRPF